MARVFAPVAFRYNNTDYRYGWQDMPDSLADTLYEAGYVDFNDDRVGNGVKIRQCATLANRPAASAFGVGQCQIESTGDLYSSDAYEFFALKKYGIDGSSNLNGLVKYKNRAINEKINRWLSGRSNKLSFVSAMASPPTASISTSSTITSASGGSCSHAWDNSALNWGIEGIAQYSSGIGSSQSRTNTDGTKYGSSVVRLRFMTDAPEFELVTAYSQFVNLNLLVDGEIAYTKNPITLPTVSGARYSKFSFGANTKSYELIQAITPVAGGSGYAVGDEITLAGGTGTAAKVIVTSTGGGGAVATCFVSERGSYSVIPTGTVSQASTTGAGTGFTISALTWGASHSTRKVRKIELQFNGAIRFYGINVDANSIVMPWEAPTHLPRVAIIGDSQSAGTYLRHGFAHMGSRIANRLGLGDSYMISGATGTGWNTDNGINARWSHANRIADYSAYNPDILLFVGSQNDAQNSALQTAIESTINSIHTQLPHTKIVGVGSVLCTGSAFTKSAFDTFSGSDYCAYIDNVTSPWLSGTGKITAEVGSGNKDFYVSSDGAHLDGSGLDFFADIVAEKVFEKLSELSTL